MTRQNKAIHLVESLIKDLQEMVVGERGISANNLQTIILRLSEIRNLMS